MAGSDKSLALLGSTGSIGVQTLRVAESLGIKINALSAGSNVKLLALQARRFSPKAVAIADESRYSELKLLLNDTPIKVSAGPDAAAQLVACSGADTVLNAVVGIAGLSCTMAALQNSRRLALANKESLVTAGELVMAEAARTGCELIPVDSEHSAIFQCLNGENRDKIKRIVLTASGGPFFGMDRGQLASVGVRDALQHPNWSMGAKITVDSATMMNKGLELIEAMHLFSVPPEKIEVVVHRQSIVHSGVEFTDGAVIAQLGVPDMALPIQYALTYPDRAPGLSEPLDLFSVSRLTFERPDTDAFGCLGLAKRAAERGGLWPCVLNGANEEAVGLFLRERIPFLAIEELVSAALEGYRPASGSYTLDDVYAADLAAREAVRARTNTIGV